MLTTWCNDLKLGVPEIDSDHRHICDALDALYEQIIRGGSPAELFVRLQEIADIMAAHFSREEQMMHDLRYEDAELHLKNHYEALRILSAMVFDCEINNKRIGDDTLMLINVWTMEHINNYDKPLADAIILENMNSIIGGSRGCVRPVREYYI